MAINKLKARHPQALLTIEDLAAVVEMTQNEEEETDDEDEVKWLDGNSDSESYNVIASDSEDDDITYLSNETAADIETSLSNIAFIHGTTNNQDLTAALTKLNDNMHNHSDTKFKGIIIDTAANRRSVICEQQLKAYEVEFGVRLPIRQSLKRVVKGIAGKGEVVGEVLIPIPFNKLGIIIDVDFIVLGCNCPSLLSNKDMLTNGLDISIQGKFLYMGDRRQPLTLKNYFFIYEWDAKELPYILYTEGELRRIHRGFGHPSVLSTYNLLKRANKSKLRKSIKQEIAKIVEDCDICRRSGNKPRRFKLTAGTEELRFNHTVVVDTMFIESRAVLHMVDEATHFMAACFLRSQSASDIWKAIVRLWILTYMGPPNYLAIDQGSSYISKEMKSNAEAAGISMIEAPIENPGSIGIVERYHAPLRRAYHKIRKSLGRETSDDECLQMAVYANNTTMGSEGLCPMLLVYGAIPRPARATPSPTQLERQAVIENACRLVIDTLYSDEFPRKVLGDYFGTVFWTCWPIRSRHMSRENERHRHKNDAGSISF